MCDPCLVTTGTLTTLPMTLPMAGRALALYNRAMGILGTVDRSGHRAGLFVTPEHPCWEPLLAEARKAREVRYAKEIIPAAIADYRHRRAKTRKPLRFRHRDSMPLVLTEQIAAAKKHLGSTPDRGARIVAGGKALRLPLQRNSVEPTRAEKLFDVGIVADAHGFSVVTEDQSGQVITYRASRAALKAPGFISGMSRDLLRSGRIVVVHASKNITGTVAEALRQVVRRVKRRGAENATAVKWVGAVDRATLLCPHCHCLVSPETGTCVGCGSAITHGVLDAYAVLSQGKDRMGSVAFLLRGETASAATQDTLNEGASFAAVGDKNDDNEAEKDEEESAADDVIPTGHQTGATSTQADPQIGASTGHQTSTPHTQAQLDALSTANDFMRYFRGTPWWEFLGIPKRPLLADPSNTKDPVVNGFLSSLIPHCQRFAQAILTRRWLDVLPEELQENLRYFTLNEQVYEVGFYLLEKLHETFQADPQTGANQNTPDPVVQAAAPQPCDSVEVPLDHPRLHPWWVRLGFATKPRSTADDLWNRISHYAGRERSFYVMGRLLHLLPPSICPDPTDYNPAGQEDLFTRIALDLHSTIKADQCRG